MRGRCSTGGLVHLWTNALGLKSKKSFKIDFFSLKKIGSSIRIGREIRCLPFAGFLCMYCYVVRFSFKGHLLLHKADVVNIGSTTLCF